MFNVNFSTALVLLGTSIFVLSACSANLTGGHDQSSIEYADFESANFAHNVSDVPVDEAVRYGVLNNGMRYAILENDTPTGTAALRLVLDVGSLAEQDHQRGIAHFIEHMAFNGTANVPEGEMVSLLERYGLAFGADSNAFTGQETVGYLLNLPAVDEATVNVGLFLLRETASEMVFDTEAIDRERGVIESEERFRNTPISRFFNAYYRFLFPDTLIPERDPIGTLDVINNAPRETFVEYYEDYYVPSRAMLVVVGDINADEVEAKIKDGFDIEVDGLDIDRVDGFSTWQNPDEPAPDPKLGSVAGYDETRFGFFYDPDIYTLIFIDVLTEGLPEIDTKHVREAQLNRNLANAIVQRRIQSEINSGQSALVQANISYSNQFELANAASLFAVSSPERWRDGLQMVENELRRALEYGFTQSELDEQLANFETRLKNAADQADTQETQSLADSIWTSWISKRVYVHPQTELEWYESVAPNITVQTVKAAFDDAWSANPPQVYVSLNEELEDGSAAVKEAWRAASAVPVEAPLEEEVQIFAYTDFGPVGEVVGQTRVDDLEFAQIKFANGVKLNIKSTDFEDSVIRVRVDFGSGNLTPQPVEAAGTILSASFGGGGLEAHDRDALQRLLAGKSVGYGIDVNQDSFEFSSSTTPTDFELQMQVLTAFMTSPGWRSDGLNQFRAIAEEIRRGQNAQAVQVAINQGLRLVHGNDSRWGFPTAEEVNSFTMDHAREMLEPALKRAPIEITIVGDVELERAIEVVAATFGALPERANDWPAYEDNAVISFPQATVESELLLFNGLPNQGMANIYYPTGDGIDPARRRALNLMQAIYDLKATDRFREQEGATYSAIVSGQFSQTFEDFGFLWVGVDVDVSDISRMYGIANEIAISMSNGGITEDELQRARQPILESIEEQKQDNGYWLSALAGTQTHPERLESIRSIEEDYNAASVDSLTTLSAEVLVPERAYKISILPDLGINEP